MSGPSVFLLVVVICAAGLLAMYMPGRARNVPGPVSQTAPEFRSWPAAAGPPAGPGTFNRDHWDTWWQQEIADTVTSFPAIRAPVARIRYCPHCQYQTRADGHRKYCTGRLALTAGTR